MGRRRAGLWGWEGGERGGGRGCSHCLVKEQGFFTITGCVGCENLSSWLQSGLIGLFGYPRTEPDVPGIVAGFSTYTNRECISGIGFRVLRVPGSTGWGSGFSGSGFGSRVFCACAQLAGRNCPPRSLTSCPYAQSQPAPQRVAHVDAARGSSRAAGVLPPGPGWALQPASHAPGPAQCLPDRQSPPPPTDPWSPLP